MLRPRSVGLLLALLTLLIYLPATSYQFVNFDDPDYVTENPFVTQGLTWAGFKWAFNGAHAQNWHPLTWLAHMVDCDLFQLNPAGPHLVNILLHAGNAALLFALLFRGTKKMWPAAFVSALFAWHPLHVESVAWIAERKDVLSTFFSLLALSAYLRYGQPRREVQDPEAGAGPAAGLLWRWYWLALVFFVLALLSKPMPVMLPCVMLLLDFWPLGRIGNPEGKVKNSRWWLVLVEKIPFAACSLAVCVITVVAQHHAESSLTGVPFNVRLENAVTAYVSYLGKMIWPTQLAVFYPLQDGVSILLVGECALILLGISMLAWRWRRPAPYLLVGWFWFLITLVPVIGLVQVGAQSMADRYSYFPAIGIFLAVSFAGAAATARFSFLKNWLAAGAVAALGFCVGLTEKQLPYWHDSESLFRHALEVVQSEPAHVSLGGALMDQNRMSEALAQYIMAWRMKPGSLLANANIAGILAGEDKPEMAAIYFKRAVERNNWLPSANNNYGRVLVKLKRYDEAIKQFEAAEQIDPSQAEPHSLLGQLYLQQGREVAAAKEFRECLRREPNNLEFMVLLASILASAEDPQARNGTEAQALAEEVVGLTHRQQPAALDVLAMSCAENGQFEQAIQIQQQAIKLAETNGTKGDLPLLQKRLTVYQQHRPWRPAFKND